MIFAAAGTVAASTMVHPVNRGTPAITFDSGVASGYTGDVAAVSNGLWTGSPESFQYQWYLSGVVIDGATFSTLAIDFAITATRQLTCYVTATNQYGSSIPILSNSKNLYRTLYFSGTATPGVWNDNDNWWSDESFSVPVLTTPQTSERIYTSATITSGVPTLTLDLASLSGAGCNLTGITTRRLIVTNCDLAGSITVSQLADFYGATVSGNLTALLAIFDNSDHSGTSVITTSTFANGAINSGTVTGTAAFGTSTVNTGTIVGAAAFASNALNSGTVSTAAFTESSSNDAIGYVSGTATFANSSFNNGTIDGGATVTFPAPYPLGGTVNGAGITYIGYVLGCTNPSANNYNPAANTDDDSCTFDPPPPTDPPGAFPMATNQINTSDPMLPGIDATWDAAEEAANYRIEAYQSDMTTLITSLVLGNVLIVTNSLTGSFLPSNTYYFQVVATNAFGETPWTNGLIQLNM